MLALYEPGMTSARLDQIFGDLTSWLPGLIQTVSERQKSDTLLTRKARSRLRHAAGARPGGDGAARLLILRTAGST